MAGGGGPPRPAGGPGRHRLSSRRPDLERKPDGVENSGMLNIEIQQGSTVEQCQSIKLCPDLFIEYVKFGVD